MCREDSDMFLPIVGPLCLYHEGNESLEEETEEGEGSPATDDPSDHDSGDCNGEGENQKARSRSPRTGDQLVLKVKMLALRKNMEKTTANLAAPLDT